jgi:hypothetical protein
MEVEGKIMRWEDQRLSETRKVRGSWEKWAIALSIKDGS